MKLEALIFVLHKKQYIHQIFSIFTLSMKVLADANSCQGSSLLVIVQTKHWNDLFITI